MFRTYVRPEYSVQGIYQYDIQYGVYTNSGLLRIKIRYSTWYSTHSFDPFGFLLLLFCPLPLKENYLFWFDPSKSVLW